MIPMKIETLHAIINLLDAELENQGKTFFTPIEANKLLHEAGLLRDNPKEPGTNLRKQLKAGKIPHAYKLAGGQGHWVIPHSLVRRTLDSPYVQPPPADGPPGKS